MEEWNGRFFLRRSNIRMKISRKSYWNILNISFFFFFFFISRNALFKGAVLLVATELDKEEQCNATEGRGYANENGWFDRYSNQSLTTNGIRYLLYLRFSLCCGYVTSFCDFT